MTSVLEQPTLVLNKTWTPITVEPVREAITKASKDNAKIIDPVTFQTYSWKEWIEVKANDSEDFISTVSGRIRVPDVIVLSQYEKVHSRNLVFNRRNLFARDQNTCQFCGKRMKTSDCTVDHVIPTCQGGSNTWENCVIACVDCNVRKGGRTPKQAHMRLIRAPFKPKWSPVFRTRVIKPVWGQFLNVDAIISELYWQVELQK